MKYTHDNVSRVGKNLGEDYGRILWRIDPLLGGDSVNINYSQLKPARNNGGGVTVRDAYNRCYGAPAA
jgi:hypothetical protein